MFLKRPPCPASGLLMPGGQCQWRKAAWTFSNFYYEIRREAFFPKNSTEVYGKASWTLFQYKDHLFRYRIPTIKIWRSWDSLLFSDMNYYINKVAFSYWDTPTPIPSPTKSIFCLKFIYIAKEALLEWHNVMSSAWWWRYAFSDDSKIQRGRFNVMAPSCQYKNRHTL